MTSDERIIDQAKKLVGRMEVRRYDAESKVILDLIALAKRELFGISEQLPSPAPRVSAAMVEAGIVAFLGAPDFFPSVTNELRPKIKAALIAALAVEGK